MIYGAGKLGQALFREIANSPKLRIDPIGFIDDDPFKYGRQIQGISVIGSLDDIGNVIDKYDFQGIIFPSEDVVNIFKASQAKGICKDRGIWLRRLHVNFVTIE